MSEEHFKLLKYMWSLQDDGFIIHDWLGIRVRDEYQNSGAIPVNLEKGEIEMRLENSVAANESISKLMMRKMTKVMQKKISGYYHFLSDGNYTNLVECFIDKLQKKVFDMQIRLRKEFEKLNEVQTEIDLHICSQACVVGYEPSQITVLTTYSGQLFALKKLVGDGLLKSVRFTVVDNYQGEENDIILISFVRSNEEGDIGFLKVSNRVCVALSRAKKALYCIGNFELLKAKSPLWRNIVSVLQNNQAIGNSLQLSCQNHPMVSNIVASDKDFDNVPEGGCSYSCEFRLSCGHQCSLMCHPYDKEHETIKCHKPCSKTCPYGHSCKKLCSETCGPCTELVDKTLRSCGHTIQVQCHRKDLSKIPCTEPCKKILVCGHTCSRTCSTSCTIECLTKVDIISPICKHEFVVMNVKLLVPVVVHLVKDLVKISAFIVNALKNVVNLVTNVLNLVGGPVLIKNVHNFVGKSVIVKHVMNHVLKYLSASIPVLDYVENLVQKNVEYATKRSKGSIFGMEDEDDARFVSLEDCGHIIEVTCLTQWMRLSTEGKREIQMKACPKCKMVIRRNLRFGNIVKSCLADIEKVKKITYGDVKEI
ncbi:NFX1-type zinc finger-containing protein 1 [Trichonephila clavata]|uniref:NFX1-type zinc finger-containing protein 1 n=1 Tax=Trichonephila clavata TaxID=2740835 RepID=A0A8X6KYM3_TRICU|nr:NFX1-type zinc finger-containing protein 1 [Trichonephila clavata]